MLESFHSDDRKKVTELLHLEEQNLRAMEICTDFLNFHANSIHPEDVEELCRQCRIERQEAYKFLLSSVEGLDYSLTEDREILEKNIRVKEYYPDVCKDDPYYSAIQLSGIIKNDWKFKVKKLLPFEGFTADDTFVNTDGRELINIGFFSQEFDAPAVYQRGREWMTVTPSEQNTMSHHIHMAHGKTAVMGLGLGYYAFMAARKQDVERVDIIELDKSVIDLFRENILPQFPNQEKIHLINDDAFEFAANMSDYDTAYIDIWHDVADGTEMYLKMKKIENQKINTRFMYWIEPSMLVFIRSLLLWEVQNNQAGPIMEALGEPHDYRELLELLELKNLAKMAYKIPLEAVKRSYCSPRE